MGRQALCGAALAVTAMVGPLRADSIPPDLSGAAALAAAAAASAVPPPCTATPPADTLMGAPGTATPCTPRPDATRPTSVQAVNTTTDATGSWSVTWARSFVSASPIVLALPSGVSALPMTCAVQARSATSASGRCWQAVTTTLGATLAALAGAVITPAAAVPASTPVMVVAREPTQ